MHEKKGMIVIRNTKKMFVMACIIWAVFTTVVFLAKCQPNKDEIIQRPVTETRFVYVTEYKEPPTYYSSVSISQDDVELLARVVYLEAGNQPKVGQMAVVETILNRVLDERFPSAVYDVIYQKNQFATAPYIDISTPTQEQYDAINTVLKEVSPILDTKTVYFSTFPQTKNITAIINDHYFCS